MEETKDPVKIRHLMEQAGRLPKHDGIIVLKALLATVAEENGDWTQTLRMAIEEAAERKEVVGAQDCGLADHDLCEAVSHCL